MAQMVVVPLLIVVVVVVQHKNACELVLHSVSKVSGSSTFGTPPCTHKKKALFVLEEKPIVVRV